MKVPKRIFVRIVRKIIIRHIDLLLVAECNARKLLVGVPCPERKSELQGEDGRAVSGSDALLSHLDNLESGLP